MDWTKSLNSLVALIQKWTHNVWTALILLLDDSLILQKHLQSVVI